jgi:acrylyl-CoA reductase (NADPH)
MSEGTLRCFEVKRDEHGHPTTAIVHRSRPTPRVGEVLISVAWSSLNYKDALAATADPRVVRHVPIVPGIDAAGTVVESNDPRFLPGEKVIATSYDLGVGRDGGWSEYVCVPGEWVIPLPDGLSALEAMTLGTAGLTAGLCVAALEQHGITPARGEVLVTGATGGVGTLAVRLLAHLGYRVIAVSGKAKQREMLERFGAREVLPREALADPSTKPLLKARFAGVVDCVGGELLASALRQVQPDGCVAACGLVGGAELPLTIYPFILRGVTLAGIDSAYCTYERRAAIWQNFAGPWKLSNLGDSVTVVTLEALPLLVARMLRGEMVGRVVVSLAAE